MNGAGGAHSRDPIRVLVVDESPWTRRGICSVLAEHDAFELLDPPHAILSAFGVVVRYDPTLVVLVAHGPLRPIVRLAGQIHAEFPHILLIAVGVRDQAVTQRRRLAQLGVRGCLPLLSSERDLIDAASKIAGSPSQRQLASDTNVTDGWLPRLTRREHQILRLVSLGRRNREISEQLSISEGTVEKHVKQLLRKSGTRGRHDLRVAFEQLDRYSTDTRVVPLGALALASTIFDWAPFLLSASSF